jgi:hypothetical protein
MSRAHLDGARSPRLVALILPLVLPLALAACVADGGAGGETHADAATQAACRQRADQIYNQQNRGDIYRPLEAVNTPSSAGYAPGATDRGLSELFARDQTIRDCVRNTGTGAERSEEPPSGPPRVVQPPGMQPPAVRP